MRLFLRQVFFSALVCAAVLASFLEGALAQPAQERVVPGSRAEIALSFAPIVKKAQPAVVNVFASRVERLPANPLFDDPVFQRFFGGGGGMPGRNMSQSLGSGVIVDQSGLVVMLIGSSRAPSRIPGPPPRTSTDATAALSKITAVTPEATAASWAWPTRTPGMSVSRFFMFLFFPVTSRSQHAEQSRCRLHSIWATGQ